LNLLQIIDQGEAGVQLSWQRGNAVPRFYGPIPFSDPLTAKARKELRWYLEDYLQFPYGAERDRASIVEDEMARWGESLFRQVFVEGETKPDPYLFYHEAVREGLEQCQLGINSDDPAFLNIPWELLRDPTPGRGYLAPLLGALYRQRSQPKIVVGPEYLEDEPFRILLVIARPYGKTDIPLRTVAQPILDALRPLRPRVELELLRPPTFQALVNRLNDQRGRFQMVHFDGHGAFGRPPRGPLMAFGAGDPRGYLVFEKADGLPDRIASDRLGQALATSKVSLFALNACQSAIEGTADPFSSVAAQLLATGANGVVAMSYSVYADTASAFMQRFYERLVAHAPLAGAVASARMDLYTDTERQSVIGPIDLRDWIVPVLYQQEQRYVPIPEVAGADTSEAAADASETRPRL